MKTKSVLNAVLLALAVIVIQFAGSFLGFIGPFWWVYNAAFVAFFAAFPYIALTRKHPVFGMALLPAALLLLICMPMGEGDLQTALLTLGFALVAEVLRYFCGGYASRSSRVASYCVVALYPFANTLRMWITPDSAMAQTVEEMGEAYGSKMESLVALWWVLPLMICLTLALAYAGATVAERRKK